MRECAHQSPESETSAAKRLTAASQQSRSEKRVAPQCASKTEPTNTRARALAHMKDSSKVPLPPSLPPDRRQIDATQKTGYAVRMVFVRRARARVRKIKRSRNGTMDMIRLAIIFSSQVRCASQQCVQCAHRIRIENVHVAFDVGATSISGLSPAMESSSMLLGKASSLSAHCQSRRVSFRITEVV